MAIEVPAAERTVRVLELALKYPHGMTPQMCLAQLEISRSSLFALLSTLKKLGYLEQGEERGVYRPGPRLKAWRGSIQLGPKDLLTAFYQEAMSPPVNETLALAVADREEVIILAQVQGPQRVRSVFEEGEVCQAESSAWDLLGKAPEVSIQEAGYAVVLLEDAVEIALPVCADGYTPSAALLVSAPRLRCDIKKMLTRLPALREMAARLSYRIGAPVYAPFQFNQIDGLSPETVMDAKEIEAFLKGPWAARLAVVRPDGAPHVVPVWHVWDGEFFYVVSWKGALWGDYLAKNGLVSLIIDEPWPPLRRVVARGCAEELNVDALPGGLEIFLNSLSQRYLGHASWIELEEQIERAYCICPEVLAGWRGLHKRRST
jgi:DNA-binding IclR family transcriptional regulator